MRILGVFFIVMGIVLLVGEIVTGEVCGRGGRKCTGLAENPEIYWRWFLVGPAFCVVFGWTLITRHDSLFNASEFQFRDALPLLIAVGGSLVVGQLIVVLFY